MMEWLINATSWKMERPRAYGTFHLTFWIIGLMIVIPIAYFLARRLKDKGNNRLLFILGIIMALSEVYKQFFYTYIYGAGTYQWYMLPFQLCSIPMYLCLIIPWLGKGRLMETLYGFLVSFGFMGGIVSYIAPGTMCRDYITITVHSFIWHMLLIFIGIYVGLSGHAGSKLKNYLYVALTYVSLAVAAFGINCLCYNQTGLNGTKVNMFYIGPHRSTLIVCRDICDNYGYILNAFIYTSTLICCAFLFYLMWFIINRYMIKRKKTE